MQKRVCSKSTRLRTALKFSSVTDSPVHLRGSVPFGSTFDENRSQNSHERDQREANSRIPSPLGALQQKLMRTVRSNFIPLTHSGKCLHDLPTLRKWGDRGFDNAEIDPIC